MLILGVDASLPILSVALLDDAGIVGAFALIGKSSRNEKLLPAIDWLLTENAIDRRSIDRFAVTRGPGSFTGVRIGLATVQGLALALGRPVCAMSTHEAIALGERNDGLRYVDAGCRMPDAGEPQPSPSAIRHPTSDIRISVVDDAGRGEWYVSRFSGRREVEAPRLVSPSELESVLHETPLIIRVDEFVQRANVAVGCARRAAEIANHDEEDSYLDITPIYVRLAEADVKLQQQKQ